MGQGADGKRFATLRDAVRPLMDRIGKEWGNILYTHGLWTWHESAMFHRIQAAMNGEEPHDDCKEPPPED